MFRIPLRNCRAAVLSLGAIFCLSVFTLATLSAQTDTAKGGPDRTHIEEVMRGLNRGRGFGQVGISPDGKRLAWIDGGREGPEIRVASPTDLTKSERVTAATNTEQHCREGEFVWAPDSKGLAFFSDCASSSGHQVDLYFSRLDGSPARRLTALKGLPLAPAFSPTEARSPFFSLKEQRDHLVHWQR